MNRHHFSPGVHTAGATHPMDAPISTLAALTEEAVERERHWFTFSTPQHQPDAQAPPSGKDKSLLPFWATASPHFACRGVPCGYDDSGSDHSLARRHTAPPQRRPGMAEALLGRFCGTACAEEAVTHRHHEPSVASPSPHPHIAQQHRARIAPIFLFEVINEDRALEKEAEELHELATKASRGGKDQGTPAADDASVAEMQNDGEQRRKMENFTDEQEPTDDQHRATPTTATAVGKQPRDRGNAEVPSHKRRGFLHFGAVRGHVAHTPDMPPSAQASHNTSFGVSDGYSSFASATTLGNNSFTAPTHPMTMHMHQHRGGENCFGPRRDV